MTLLLCSTIFLTKPMIEYFRLWDMDSGVYQYSEAELHRHRIFVREDGVILDAIGKLLTTRTWYGTKERWIYVVMPDYKIYVARPSFRFIHHSSMSYGEPTLLAGTIEVHRGHIVNVDLESGHYKHQDDKERQRLIKEIFKYE